SRAARAAHALVRGQWLRHAPAHAPHLPLADLSARARDQPLERGRYPALRTRLCTPAARRDLVRRAAPGDRTQAARAWRAARHARRGAPRSERGAARWLPRAVRPTAARERVRVRAIERRLARTGAQPRE